MLDPRFRLVVPPVLTVLLLAGCGGRTDVADELRSTTPPAPTDASATPRVHLSVSSATGDFRAEGWVEQGQLLTVADTEGNALGFRPVGIEPFDGDSTLVSIDVLKLANMGTGEQTSEERLAGIKVLEGDSGTVDPGDEDGPFIIVVESVSGP